ncbi:MAG TPA: YIP1 family protein [Myxococcaceae bacterium]|jgi:hypothetical protein
MEAALPQCALHPGVVAQQACSRCGNFACQACLVSLAGGRPLCATCDARDGAREVPWDQRAKLGTVSAFVRTCWQIVTHPVATLDRATAEGSVGSSLWFVVLAEFTTYLTTGLVYAAVGVAMMGVYLFGADQTEKTLTPLTTGGIALLVGVIFVATVLLVGIGGVLILSLLDHAVLRLVGARPRSFQVTLRAHALSLAPCLAGLVPFCGVYAVPVWAVVLRIFAYRGMHKISTGHALLGALAVPGTLVLLAGASWVALILMAAGSQSL